MPSPTGAHYEHQRIIEEERDRASAFAISAGIRTIQMEEEVDEVKKPDLLGPIKAAVEKGITEGAPRKRKITL